MPLASRATRQAVTEYLPLPPGRYRLSVADYAMLADAGAFGGASTELIDGEVFVMSPEWMPHMRIKDEIAYRLRRAIEALGLDLRVGTGGTVNLSDVDQPRPDVIVMRPVVSDRGVPREAVLLLVEVSSSTLTFDLNDKAPMYARHGIAEYWMVDVAGRVLHRWSLPADHGYAAHQDLRFGALVESATIVGLSISTDGL